MSTSGGHVAYIVSDKQKITEIRDGKPGREFQGPKEPMVEHLTFSPDGLRLAYVVSSRGSRWSDKPERRLLVVDGEQPKEFESVKLSELLFSPDNKHLAFVLSGARRSALRAGSYLRYASFR